LKIVFFGLRVSSVYHFHYSSIAWDGNKLHHRGEGCKRLFVPRLEVARLPYHMQNGALSLQSERLMRDYKWSQSGHGFV